MTNSNIPLNLQHPHWQAEKYLKSGDRVWILTDVETYESSFMAVSKPQTLFKCGVYDLETNRVGWGIFGRDTAFAMARSGVQSPPWDVPQLFAIELHRDPHSDGEEKGRYTGSIELIPIEPKLLDVVSIAKKKFDFAGHRPNSTRGIWDDLLARAARENAVEAAALGMVGPFAAADVRAAIGDENADITAILQRLVREGKLLPPTGRKRWTRYEVAPPLTIERVDWVD